MSDYQRYVQRAANADYNAPAPAWMPFVYVALVVWAVVIVGVMTYALVVAWRERKEKARGFEVKVK